MSRKKEYDFIGGMGYTFINSNVYDFKNKQVCVRNNMQYMFSKTSRMFKYENLPKTIDKRLLELWLQSIGYLCCFKAKTLSNGMLQPLTEDLKGEGDLYICFGAWGGELDGNYLPKQFIIANPVYGSFTLEVGKNCIIIKNDSTLIGLTPLCRRYATALTETELSLKISSVLTRLMTIVATSDKNTKESYEVMIKKLEEGDLLSVFSSQAIMDEEVIKSLFNGQNNNQSITQLIELLQYYKASWFNELGLNANYNMKRESLNSSESQLNDDALLPFVDDMLLSRQESFDKVNEMFGTNIQVDLGLSWKLKKDEMIQEVENKEVDKDELRSTEPTYTDRNNAE